MQKTSTEAKNSNVEVCKPKNEKLKKL